MTRLAIADLVWRFWLVDWESRCPDGTQPQTGARWLRELSALGEERDRPAFVARFYGIDVQPGTARH